MSDVTNPGIVNVADEVLENPDPNNSLRLLVPEQDDALVAAGNQGYPRAGNDVDVELLPIPTNVAVTQVPTGQKVQAFYVPDADEVIVDQQVIGQGVWVYIDPMNPGLGKKFVPPGEFVVVGPAESIQTNASEATTVLCTITGVYDADNLWNLPDYTTTRYILLLALPDLSSYNVSVLGRPIVFANDTITVGDQGAVRYITAYQGIYPSTTYGMNFVVINRVNQDDPNVPDLVVPVTAPNGPQVGDTFVLNIQRQGSQDISLVGTTPINVVILPPPPANVPNPGQALNNQGTIEVAIGPQPGQTIITGGTQVPTAINVNVADQATAVGLPVNVFI